MAEKDIEALVKLHIAAGEKFIPLQGQRIGDIGVKVVAERFATAHIKELNIGCNDITDAGAESVGTMLVENANNRIGDGGAAWIADGLQRNTCLTKLDLSHNNVGEAGATSILDCLKRNTSLTRLELAGNPIPKWAEYHIKKEVEANMTAVGRARKCFWEEERGRLEKNKRRGDIGNGKEECPAEETDCPVCGKSLANLSNVEVNTHVDECLSKTAIQDMGHRKKEQGVRGRKEQERQEHDRERKGRMTSDERRGQEEERRRQEKKKTRKEEEESRQAGENRTLHCRMTTQAMPPRMALHTEQVANMANILAEVDDGVTYAADVVCLAQAVARLQAEEEDAMRRRAAVFLGGAASPRGEADDSGYEAIAAQWLQEAHHALVCCQSAETRLRQVPVQSYPTKRWASLVEERNKGRREYLEKAQQLLEAQTRLIQNEGNPASSSVLSTLVEEAAQLMARMRKEDGGESVRKGKEVHADSQPTISTGRLTDSLQAIGRAIGKTTTDGDKEDPADVCLPLPPSLEEVLVPTQTPPTWRDPLRGYLEHVRGAWRDCRVALDQRLTALMTVAEEFRSAAAAMEQASIQERQLREMLAVQLLEAGDRILEISNRRVEEHQVENERLACQMAVLSQEIQEQRAIQSRYDEAIILIQALQDLRVSARAKSRQRRAAMEEYEDADPSEMDVVKAEARLDALRQEERALLARRNGLYERLNALSQRHSETDVSEVEILFPELMEVAHRTWDAKIDAKLQHRGASGGPARGREAAVAMVRKLGLLLSVSRSDYSEDDVPGNLPEGISSKVHVNVRRRRGTVGPNGVKVLKEIPLDEFKRIRGAVVHAHRLSRESSLVVPVEGAFVEGETIIVQTPFYPGGNLRQWAKGRSLLTLLPVLTQVAEAVSLLHRHKIIHRDVKPENVVMTSSEETARPAICDFDLSRSMSDLGATVTTLGVGTMLYMAPELHQVGTAREDQTPAYSFASDVFALGVLLLEVLCYDADHDRLPRTRQMQIDLSSVKRRLEQDSHMDPALRDLVLCLLAKDPDARPPAARIAVLLDGIERRLALADATGQQRVCVICQGDFLAKEGVECGGGTEVERTSEGTTECHFLCNDCFTQYVENESTGELGDRGKRGGLIWCPLARKIIGKQGSCDSPAYDPQIIAEHVPVAVFELYLRGRDELVAQDLDRKADERVKQEVERLARLSQVELQVTKVRKHITDTIMTLRCPRCATAFLDYTGCAALKCAACPCHFCGLCLHDCNGDAHPHVRACHLNPSGGELFVSEGAWKQVQQRRRRELLSQYWKAEVAVQGEEVIQLATTDKTIRTSFADVELRVPGEGEVRAGLAQLGPRGMGFAEEAVILALRRAGGDVERAAALLLAEQE